MLIKGFRFGMLLQLAVGPVCIYLFQTAITKGLLSAFTGVAAVVLVDSLYILAAIGGIGALLNRSDRLKHIFRLVGGAVVVLFGLNNILAEFGLSFLSVFRIRIPQQVGNTFLYVLLLTLSNPLTILFWAGVFSTKLAQEQMNKSDIYLFGLGAVCSTMLFLSLVSILGGAINLFITDLILTILNIVVGIVLIVFGVRSISKKV